MGPIDYTGAFAGVPDPSQAFMRGMKNGTEIAGLRLQQQERDLKLQAYQKQQVRTQSMQAELAALARDPSPQAIAAMSVKYPELSEQFKRSYDMMAPEVQRANLDSMSQVYAAVQSGRTDIAQQLLTQRADAMEKSGVNPQQVQSLRTMAQWAEQHPESFKTSAGLTLAAALGPEKFATTYEALQKQARENEQQPLTLAKTQAETDNIRSQIADRSARLKLDGDKIYSDYQLEIAKLQQKNGELQPDTRKLVNDSTIASVSAEQSAGKMDDLAVRIEAAAQAGELSDGQTARFKEWFKNATGNQNYVTDLRNEYTRLRTTGILKNLPPGPATDRDIEMASKGFPPENADPATMASFLRGMGKMHRLEAANEAAKAEWAGAVGHLGKPKQDIEIEGIKVPAGSSFTDFARQYMGRMSSERAAPATPSVQQRGYMRHAGGK